MSGIARTSAAFANLPSAVRAAMWFLLAGGTFVGMMAMVRHLSGDVHMLVIVFWRSVVGILVMLPWLIRRGPSALHTRRLGWHISRAALVFASLLAWFYAATMMPLADITAMGFTRPIIASVLAVILLGEVMHGRRWTAVLIGFVGAMIIVRPGFAEVNPGVFLVLAGVAGASVLAILTKFIVRTDSPDTMTMYLVAFMTPISLIAALFVWHWPTPDQFVWLAAIGGIATVSQLALARAYNAADATVVLSFDFLRLPVAAAIGFVFFSEFPDIWVWVGAAVICGSSVYVAHREAAAERRKVTGEAQ